MIFTHHTQCPSPSMPFIHCVQFSVSTLLLAISLTSNPLIAPRSATLMLGRSPVAEPAYCTFQKLAAITGKWLSALLLASAAPVGFPLVQKLE